LRQAATETAHSRENDLDEEILELIEGDGELDVEAYWERVEENLEAGRVRLLFVLDSAPKELRRLVEFLDEKMADVEVLVVEIKQYLSEDGQRVVVPRALGVSARRRREAKPSRRRVDRGIFLGNCAPWLASFVEEVLDRAEERGHEITWGTKGFSVRAILPGAGKKASFVYGYPNGTFQFYFAQLQMVLEEERKMLREQLLGFGLFREGGEYTLTNELTKEDFGLARQVYERILEKMDAIVDAHYDLAGGE